MVNPSRPLDFEKLHNYIVPGLWRQDAARRDCFVQSGHLRLSSILGNKLHIEPSQGQDYEHIHLALGEDAPRAVHSASTERPKGLVVFQFLIFEESKGVEVLGVITKDIRVVVHRSVRHNQLSARLQHRLADCDVFFDEPDADRVIGPPHNLQVEGIELGTFVDKVIHVEPIILKSWLDLLPDHLEK